MLCQHVVTHHHCVICHHAIACHDAIKRHQVFTRHRLVHHERVFHSRNLVICCLGATTRNPFSLCGVVIVGAILNIRPSHAILSLHFTRSSHAMASLHIIRSSHVRVPLHVIWSPHSMMVIHCSQAHTVYIELPVEAKCTQVNPSASQMSPK